MRHFSNVAGRLGGELSAASSAFTSFRLLTEVKNLTVTGDPTV
jgi:hypothetical protein